MTEESITRRITNDLRKQIKDGTLGPGALLPSEPELARKYDISRQTARIALRALEEEGLVSTQARRGRIVRRPHPIRRLGPDRYARHRWQRTTVDAFATESPVSTKVEQQGSQAQTISLIPADERVAKAFGIKTSTQVYERARVVTREGEPTHTMTSYYLPLHVDKTPIVDSRPGMAGQNGSFQIFTDQGLPPHSITEELFGRMPTNEEKDTLDLPLGEPVIELHRTTHTQDGTVIEFARGVHAASRFIWEFTYDVPD